MKRKVLAVLSGVTSFLALPIVTLAQTSDDGFSYTYKGNVDPTTASQVAGTIGLITFVVVCVVMIVHIAVTIWVYKDAKKRNANVALWTIVTFLFIIFGFIVYLLAGRKSGTPSQASTPSATPVSSN